MPKNYSIRYHETVNSVSAGEAPLLLLEIAHPDLAEPIRVVNDNQDLVHQGALYIALSFRATPPDDLESGQPRASLAVDNVGRELVQWLEASAGGQGATCRMLQVLRSDPDVVEWEVTMGLSNVQMDMIEVRGELSFDDILNLPGVTLTYRPDTQPGLF